MEPETGFRGVQYIVVFQLLLSIDRDNIMYKGV